MIWDGILKRAEGMSVSLCRCRNCCLMASAAVEVVFDLICRAERCVGRWEGRLEWRREGRLGWGREGRRGGKGLVFGKSLATFVGGWRAGGFLDQRVFLMQGVA